MSIWLVIIAASIVMVTPGHAAIVYVVPSNPIGVPEETFFDPILFDLDGDGTDEFQLRHAQIEIEFDTIGMTRVIADVTTGALVEALPDGGFIGAELGDGGFWVVGPRVLNHCINAGGFVCRGEFQGGRDFMGVEFDISGSTHYGWVQIESFEFSVAAVVIDWAYESEPDTPILAGQIPEPSASLLVVCAAATLLLIRRR